MRPIDALDRAITELLAGRSLQDVAAEMPESLRPLLKVAGRFAGHAGPSDGEPSPTFVLSLEEQLRTDMRLSRTNPPATVSRTWWSRMAGPVMLVATAAVLMMSTLVWSSHAIPGHPLYPVKRAVEAARLSIAGAPADRVARLCDQSWERLDEIQRLLQRGTSRWPLVTDTLDELVFGYATALDLAETIEGQPRTLRRAQVDAGLASDQLALLAAGRTGAERRTIEEASRSLHVRLLDSRVAVAVGDRDDAGAGREPRPGARSGPAAGAGAGQATVRPGVGGVVAEPAPSDPTSVTVQEQTDTPPTATATPAVPIGGEGSTATPLPPTTAPITTATSTPPPTRQPVPGGGGGGGGGDEPTATPTPPDTASPPPTMLPVDPSPTPKTEPTSTNTPDAWPTATPTDRGPGEPSTATPITAPPTATKSAATPTPVGGEVRTATPQTQPTVSGRNDRPPSSPAP